jgi:hypothetical protein
MVSFSPKTTRRKPPIVFSARNLPMGRAVLAKQNLKDKSKKTRSEDVPAAFHTRALPQWLGRNFGVNYGRYEIHILNQRVTEYFDVTNHFSRNTVPGPHK